MVLLGKSDALFRIINDISEVFIKIRFFNCLNALAQLQHIYFTCYNYQDYFSKQSHYEKALYQKRSAWLNKVERIRRLLHNKKISVRWHSILARIDHLSEIVFALHQLRLREREYAIFEICSFEMQSLNKEITKVLKNVAKKILWNKKLSQPVELLESINTFEIISQRILKVTSSEPIIFLFFMRALNALNDEINRIYEKLY